ncbi:MAG: YceI family protein [Deltaproteobacteria bacterium]|nr:YceI family protein [Deltaproteobacteria bacterium]
MSMRRGMGSFGLVVALGLAVQACGGAAQATMLTVLPPRIEVAERAERLPLSGSNTTVEADISALASFTIRFSRVAGELVVSPSQPDRTLLDFTVDMHSASSSPEVVADIAMGDEFLDAAQYGQAVFASRKLGKTPEGGYQILGELELHGVRRALAIPAELTIEKCEVAMSVEFAINRRDFGVESDGSLDDVVADEVVVRIATRAPRNDVAGCGGPAGEAANRG